MADQHLERISGLQPELRDKAQAVFAAAAAEGVDIMVVTGLRTFAEQTRLFSQGRTTPGSVVTNARAGESYHNFGLAFDFVVVKNGAAVWNQNHKDWIRFVEIAKAHGFEWGGDWKTFKDFPPRQKAASFTIDQAMEKMESVASGANH